MNSIPLDKERGLNPAMTICPRCGGPAEELILAGKSWKWECDDCNRIHVAYAGRVSKLECPCGNKWVPGRIHGRGNQRFTRLGEFDGSRDKAFASNPCKKCDEELTSHREEVAKGGIFWRCADCKSEGVIKVNSEFAKLVRESSGIEPPAPVGFEFKKSEAALGGPQCPVCASEEDSHV